MSFKKTILIILILIWMGIIFIFSNQPSETSGELSGNLSRKILSTTGILGKINIDNQEKVVITTEKVLRKIAHYSIYLLGGILLMSYANLYKISTNKKMIYASIAGAIYATTDEIHQYFIPGRACMWQDIWLDSLGVATGVCIMCLIYMIFNRKEEKNYGEN